MVYGENMLPSPRDRNDLSTKVVIKRQGNEGGESIGHHMEERKSGEGKSPVSNSMLGSSQFWGDRRALVERNNFQHK